MLEPWLSSSLHLDLGCPARGGALPSLERWLPGTAAPQPAHPESSSGLVGESCWSAGRCLAVGLCMQDQMVGCASQQCLGVQAAMQAQADVGIARAKELAPPAP